MLLRLSALSMVCLVLIAQSQPKEAALGAQLADDIRKQTTSLDSTTIHNYVDRLGRQLAAQLPDTHFTYTFAVITGTTRGRTHEPMALPGGYIFIPASLILKARNEEEFAGMLAHAMVHVAARHGTSQATGGQIGQPASIPLIYMGGWSGVAGDDTLLPIGFLGLKRTYELEADRRAVGVMAGAGYNPTGLASYLSRVQPPDTDLQERRSALPPVAERIAAIKQAIQQLPAQSYASGDEFLTIQEEVRRLQPRPTLRRNDRN